jgi:NADPH-ferrihemoprotein reductase
MANLDTLDVIVLGALLVGTVAYLTKGKYWGVAKDPYSAAISTANGNKPGKTRDIVKKMEETHKNCVVFYGSQTGTAEDYAARLAKEGKSRFGLETMTADLEDYDFESLDTFPEDKLAIFVLATYGEGEPTDNAVEFYEFISGEEPQFSESNDPPLGNLKYVAFGLGNNTYEHYNSMVRNVDKALTKLGAKRIGTAGEGDDGAGTMEEDFLAWKDPMWAAVAEELALDEREAVYEPIFEITQRQNLTKESSEVYLGEPNKMHLEGNQRGPFNAHNPYIAPIVESKELFTVKDRNCLHMEIDVSGSNLTYQTGDHIAIWPTNAGKEVDRFLRVTGLSDKRDTVISVKPLDSTAKVPFPTPTTYDAVVRYHMEICAPVSRQFIATLAPFAPDEKSKAEAAKLGSDKDYFHSVVANHCLNIAQVLEQVSGGQPWPAIPFSALIEGVNKIQPRYYSISSSSLVQKNKISITAVVESVHFPSRPDALKGVTTNYLLALKQKQHGDPKPDPHGLTYEITGPRNKYDGIHVPVHVRHSNFKLPSDPSKPIIMIGPGTGVAPFRAFVQERAHQVKEGQNVGKTILFFGCRKKSDDFIYEQEWQDYAKTMGDKFELITAFSRDGKQKVYVQHRLKEQGKLINELLEQKAYFYVCGDASHMAREVNQTLVQIIAENRGLSIEKAEDVVKGMRNANQYQVIISFNALNELHANNVTGGCLVVNDSPCKMFLSLAMLLTAYKPQANRAAGRSISTLRG